MLSSEIEAEAALECGEKFYVFTRSENALEQIIVRQIVLNVEQRVVRLLRCDDDRFLGD